MIFSTWLRNWKRSLDRRWVLHQTLRRQPGARRSASRPHLEVLEDRLLLSAYVVTSAADSNTAGTLPYAINQVNAGNYNEIDFQIGPAGSAQRVNISTQLPTLTASGVYIDGLSQGGPGSTTPLITLNGSGAPTFTDGLLVQGSNCTVSGLTVKSFRTNGVEIMGANNMIGGSAAGAGNVILTNTDDGVKIDSGASGNQVLGNTIGTDATEVGGFGNTNGIEILGSGNTVGGLTATAGNLISFNLNDGVLIDHVASGNQVLGNYIGTDVSGTIALANGGNGIEVFGADNTIGGTTSWARNLISGNSGGDGVLINSVSSRNQILGNYIGTSADGAAALGNVGSGIELAGISNTVGGSVSGASNVISGNSKAGVLIDSTSSGNQILGNDIGTNFDGTAALGNSGNGIEIAGISNTVGIANFDENSNIISGNRGDGVLIDSTANGNQVEGNRIGTNTNGFGALANGGNGIEIRGSSNTIGGNTTNNQGNLISGNKGDGVRIDSGGNSNSLYYSYIGTNANGNAALANSIGVEIASSNNFIASGEISGNIGDGVLIDSSGNQLIANVIGNDGALDRVANSIGVEINGSNNSITGNAISGNTGDGVRINRGVTGIQVVGNRIGTNDDGDAALSNSIGIEVDGFSNTIGGTAAGAGNIISGNSNDGVLITDIGNQLLGNYIGTDIHGNTAIANSIGIELAFESNTVGAGNVISGNSSAGVKIDSGVSGVQVLDNSIGTNAAGTSALSNNVGIELDGAGNTVGGTSSGAGNLISGNGYAGVLVSGSANQVLGNSIGVAAGGNSALADGTGIYVNGGSGNTIGGTVSAARNLISGNSTDGVNLNGNNNQVLGNFIGTNAAGSAALANQHNGIYVQSGSGNTIGGNLISGNGSDGVLLASSGNLVLGNTVGATAGGVHGLGNSSNGIEISGNNNTLGGTVAGALNIISGNGGDGVRINSSASGTLVLGNYIGTTVDGNGPLGNSNGGVEIAGNLNTVGGTSAGAGNLISANSNDGVLIDAVANSNQVQGNSIGTNADGNGVLGNGGNGIEIIGRHNTVGGGNLISDSSLAGVVLSSGNDNAVRHNSIFANGPTNTGPGITLQNGANNNIAAPVLSAATLSGTTLTVNGTFTAATANITYFLDFYANPSGDPEGKVLLGSLTVTPTSTGPQAFTFKTTTTETEANPLITATLTDAFDNTSAFSNGVTAGSSLLGSPPPSPPPGSSPPGSSPTGSTPPINSTPTLSPLQMALEIALDTAAFLVQGDATALLEMEGLSAMFLGQTLPQPSDLLSTILSELSVSGSAELLGLQLGINLADSVKGTTR